MEKRKKILVTGANGQLGKELRDLEKEFSQYEFLFLSREDLPIHHYELVRITFDAFKPDYCINCAAYTAVDRAEQESDLAFIVNAESVGILAAVSAAHSTKFIHVSTDYVYGGDSAIPYKETDPASPSSVYGASKKAGEDQAFKYNPDTIVIRTSWVYSCYGNNFVKTMMRLMKERDEIGVVNDQQGSPTSATDLASFIMGVIGYTSWHPGIYNFSNAGEITWYDFAVEIKNLLGTNCRVNPIPTSAYPTPAKRPSYSVMDKTKIKQVYGVEPNDWKQSLAVCMKRLVE
jgi:dTDP-4-dehydrorhamnose reductase